VTSPEIRHRTRMSIVLSGAQGVKLGDLVSSQSMIPDRDLFNRSRRN
jgi:hypothetical protein